ncbi:MAG: PQQ-binding-like beta-propeller repeat protein [Hyphomicrobiales bacterium]
MSNIIARHFMPQNGRGVVGAKYVKFSLLGAVLVSLAGCAGIDVLADGVKSINPFAEEEQLLPGARREALPMSDPMVVDGVRTASISPAASFANWNNPSGNEANNPGNVALAGGGSGRVWSAQVAERPGRRGIRNSSGPVVEQGRVYVYDPKGNVTASSLSGGSRLWRVSLKPEGEKQAAPGGGIASGGGFVYAATGYSEVVGLIGGNGSEVWRYDLGEPARGAPTYAGGRVFVVTISNEVVALSAADGTLLWTYTGIPEVAGLLAASSPAVSGSTVVVPYSSGEIIAFDVESGDPKWSDAVVRSNRNLAVSGLSDVSGSPVIADGVVFATGVSGRTIAVNLKTGERLWERNIGSSFTPIVSGNAVFIQDLQDRMIALDRKTGEGLWIAELPVVRKKRSRTAWAGPVLAGGALWSASSDGRIASVDATGGQLLGTRDINKDVFLKPIAAGGRLLLLAGDGTMMAYN